MKRFLKPNDKYYNFHETKRWLKRHFPSLYKVRVVIKDVVYHPDTNESLWGLTTFNKESQTFYIQLCSKTNTDHLTENLFHEYSHVLQQHNDISAMHGEIHDDVFWSYYGKIYRKWYNE